MPNNEEFNVETNWEAENKQIITEDSVTESKKGTNYYESTWSVEADEFNNQSTNESLLDHNLNIYKSDSYAPSSSYTEGSLDMNFYNFYSFK